MSIEIYFNEELSDKMKLLKKKTNTGYRFRDDGSTASELAKYIMRLTFWRNQLVAWKATSEILSKSIPCEQRYTKSKTQKIKIEEFAKTETRDYISKKINEVAREIHNNLPFEYAQIAYKSSVDIINQNMNKMIKENIDPNGSIDIIF